MDLREARLGDGSRHPWELARMRTVLGLLHRYCRAEVSQSVIDIGCGDAFLTARVAERFSPRRIVGLDIHLTDAALEGLRKQHRSLALERDPSRCGGPAECVLLLDVLEHIEEDSSFLSSLVEGRLSHGGKLLVTVPAFESLFSAHDEFLGHFRRYSLESLRQRMEQSGLQVLAGGYLFTTLVLPRWLSVSWQKWVSGPMAPRGIGAWKGGLLVTGILTVLLSLDNSLSVRLNGWGIRPPGLSVWAVGSRR